MTITITITHSYLLEEENTFGLFSTFVLFPNPLGNDENPLFLTSTFPNPLLALVAEEPVVLMSVLLLELNPDLFVLPNPILLVLLSPVLFVLPNPVLVILLKPFEERLLPPVLPKSGLVFVEVWEPASLGGTSDRIQCTTQT